MEASQLALISGCAALGAVLGALAPACVRRLPEPEPEAPLIEGDGSQSPVPAEAEVEAPLTEADGSRSPARAEVEAPLAEGDGSRSPGRAGAEVRPPIAEADRPRSPVPAGAEVKPPYVELARWPGLPYAAAVAGALGAGLLAWRLGWHPALPAWLYLVAAGVVLAYVDIRVRLLPNAIVLPSYPIVVVLLLAGAALSGEWGALLRALICGAALWVLFAVIVLIYPAGMGFGDVKLAGLLGLGAGWFGAAAVVLGLVLSFCLGGLVSLLLVLTRRAGRKSALPFGPFLLAGFLAAVLTGPALIAWYVGQMP